MDFDSFNLSDPMFPHNKPSHCIESDHYRRLWQEQQILHKQAQEDLQNAKQSAEAMKQEALFWAAERARLLEEVLRRYAAR